MCFEAVSGADSIRNIQLSIPEREKFTNWLPHSKSSGREPEAHNIVICSERGVTSRYHNYVVSELNIDDGVQTHSVD